MSRISEKLVALLLVAFFVSYAGYQIYGFYNTSIQVETAYEYSVSHSITAEGIAIRSEALIDEKSSGLEYSVFEDGMRVSTGQALVEYYASNIGDAQRQQMRQLEKEISALTEAQNPAISNFSNVDSFSRDIRSKLRSFSRMASTGRFSEAEELSDALILQINKKQIAIDKEDNYEDRIARLQAQYDQLGQIAVTTSVEAARAPLSGYYVKTIDGMEALTMDAVEGYTVDQYISLVENAFPQPSNELVGKIVTNSTWYFAAIVPAEDVEWVNKGKKVTLNFETIDSSVPGVVEDVIAETITGDAVLLIRINYISGDLLNLRREQAVIHLEEYAGLRISTSSIHFQKNRAGEEVRGVYILSSDTVRFRAIDPVYEEPGFVLSREFIPTEIRYADEEEEEGEETPPPQDAQDEEEPVEVDESIPENYAVVARYDQIITKGRDLYHGKVIE